MTGLVDCDNFFCSCERVFRPDLEGKPMVVLSNNDGCVVARSKEVKALGIKEGMPYYQMLEQFPNAGIVAFSSNYALYGDMSARIMSILRESVPEVIQYSIDEAFLNLDGMERNDLKHWGEELCAKVLRWTGMPVSLGIAPTKTLAKMATKFAKKYPGYRKCCLIGTDEQREKALRLFPVNDVWGIGRRTTRKLENLGVNTAYDFSQKPRSWVRSKFHVTGERTWAELRGECAIDIESMEELEKKTIVTSRSFPQMISDLEDLRSHVANYAARCALKLRKQHSVCSMITVFIQSNHFRDDLEQCDRSGVYSFATATNTTNELVRVANLILNDIYVKGISYKRAGVMVSEISTARAIQPDLFKFNPVQRLKYDRTSQALDTINRSFGDATIVLGAQQQRRDGVLLDIRKR